jgi:hypothetical protein
MLQATLITRIAACLIGLSLTPGSANLGTLRGNQFEFEHSTGTPMWRRRYHLGRAWRTTGQPRLTEFLPRLPRLTEERTFDPSASA